MMTFNSTSFKGAPLR